MSDLSLPTLYKRSLESSSKSVNLPTINDETQVRIYHPGFRSSSDELQRTSYNQRFGT